MSCEHGEDEPEEGDAVEELMLLVTHPACLEPDELRDALRLARRLGRSAAETKRRAPGLEHYKRTYVEAARTADILAASASDYWDSHVAALDGRVVALAGGWREGRRDAG
jgi:hypothetical protein